MLDDDDTVLAREPPGAPVDRRAARGRAASPTGFSRGTRGIVPLIVPYEPDGRRERLVYLSQPGDMTAYEELRTGFTAAVSHELRTPLARLLSLLETATLPGEDVLDLVERARAEVEQIRELIDEVLFLSELESGAPRRLARRACRCAPELDAVVAGARGARLARRRRRSSSRASRRSSSRSGRACCASSRRTSPRTRSATPARARRSRSRSSGPTGRGRAARHRRRRRRPRGGAAAAVRALLPRRPRARLTRDGARPRDRQAHRRRRRGDASRRGAARAPGLEIRCSSRPAATASPVLHQTFTTRSPGLAARRSRARRRRRHSTRAIDRRDDSATSTPRRRKLGALAPTSAGRAAGRRETVFAGLAG